jgi:flavin reductase (DIM6/NTAB) family NADH-FMN oxidoreductase RutF
MRVRTLPSRATGGATLRQVMRHHAAGVAVITCGADEPTGFCATSLTSVCLDPPMISFAVAAGSASGRAWAVTEHGLVHLLGSDQQELARRFARSGPEKFEVETAWRPGPYGQPMLDDVVGWLLVSPRTRLSVGDHLMVICAVQASSVQTGASPLVHHDGGFYSLPC